MFEFLVTLVTISFLSDLAVGKNQRTDIAKITFLTSGVQLPKYSDRTEEETLQAIINYFINQQSNHSEICLVDFVQETLKVGVVPIHSFRGSSSGKSINFDQCFEPKLFELYRDYPYSCFDEETSKTFRVDWLVSKLMIQDIYHEADNVPLNRTDTKKQYGIDLRFGSERMLRKIIPTSIVARDVRALGLLKDSGGHVRAITTFDFNAENKKGPDASFSANPLEVAFDASETFLIKPNSLWSYQLLDQKNDKRINAAPAGVADFHEGISATDLSDSSPSVRAHANYVSIRNGVDCLTCHKGGSLSEGYPSINKQIIQDTVASGIFDGGINEALVRQFYNVPPGKESDIVYDDSTEFDGLLHQEQKRFEIALRQMQVLKGDNTHPFLPDIAALYSMPLTLDILAKELNVPVDELQNRINADPLLKKLLGLSPYVETRKLSLDRALFEQRFCELWAKIFEKEEALATVRKKRERDKETERLRQQVQIRRESAEREARYRKLSFDIELINAQISQKQQQIAEKNQEAAALLDESNRIYDRLRAYKKMDELGSDRFLAITKKTESLKRRVEVKLIDDEIGKLRTKKNQLQRSREALN